MNYVGRGSIEQLSKLLPRGGHVLIFTRQSIYRRFEAQLAPQLADVHTHFFAEIAPNPTREEVQAAQDALRGQEYAAIVAFGGGSALDFAKAWRHYEGCTAPLIAIPTTAGTGSEATQFSVICIDGAKASIDDPKLLPEEAIVDSQFVENAPQYLKACCAMDAYCQAIESYWAKRATPASRELALQAVELCREHLVAAVTTAEPHANEQLALAAHLSGRAINTSRTTAAHALSYRITSRYDIPHGHAVALCMPGLFLANLPAIEGLPTLLQAMGANDGNEAAASLRSMMCTIGLEPGLAKLGITDLDDIAASVHPQRLGNNPRLLSHSEMVSLLALSNQG